MREQFYMTLVYLKLSSLRKFDILGKTTRARVSPFLNKEIVVGGALGLGTLLLFSGCTVKAVGDPNRPITINAHVTLDIKGLKETASSIEDYVSGEAPVDNLKVKGKK